MSVPGLGATPETRYARSGSVRIAYQVVGSGPLDLVLVPGFVSNLDLLWEEPELRRFLERLASFSRLILFDKRGTGLSDRVGRMPNLEERMDDVRAVMDAVGARRAGLLGISEGGAMSILFAATYPARTRALILYGAYAHFPEWVLPEPRLQAFLNEVDRDWGSGASLARFAPSRLADPEFRRWWARFERLGASPSDVIQLMRMNSEIDIRHILPAIRVPTLVLHRSEDSRVEVGAGRFLGSHIPGARYVELKGADHVLWAMDTRPLADLIEEFLTGARARVPVDGDRVLATVLFTDIVASTSRAAALGDRPWRDLLERHDAALRGELQRFRGRAVKTMGDGLLAVFDGPARAVRCALAMTEAVKPLGLSLRSGLHTGEVETTGEDISGIAVHTAARVAALAEGGEVLVSRTVRDLVAGSGLHFVPRGSHALKGIPEPVELHAAAA